MLLPSKLKVRYMYRNLEFSDERNTTLKTSLATVTSWFLILSNAYLMSHHEQKPNILFHYLTFLIRPSLKMTALSYSWTILMQKKMEIGNVRTIRMTEKERRTISQTPPAALPSSALIPLSFIGIL